MPLERALPMPSMCGALAIACVMACNITLMMPVKSPKREKHGHWRMARKSGALSG